MSTANNTTRVWIEDVDEDGDYGYLLICNTCQAKFYLCNCPTESESTES